jgi:hypothetical protein
MIIVEETAIRDWDRFLALFGDVKVETHNSIGFPATVYIDGRPVWVSKGPESMELESAFCWQESIDKDNIETLSIGREFIDRFIIAIPEVAYRSPTALVVKETDLMTVENNLNNGAQCNLNRRGFTPVWGFTFEGTDEEITADPSHQITIDLEITADYSHQIKINLGVAQIVLDKYQSTATFKSNSPEGYLSALHVYKKLKEGDEI